MGDILTRRDRAVLWALRRLPAPVLVNPERVAIKAAVTLIGAVTLLFVRPSSLTSLLPVWVPYLWGATWLLGGLFGLVGYWRSSRKLEMAGHRLVILGAVIYGIAIVATVGTPGFAAVILVGFIAGCSVVRLLIAAGARLSRGRDR